ncbi:DUF1998 domain-containing protein [Halorubrum tropicale]|nr:DUF1998 domain-containing protein [Halorubrum tropicale]
MSEENGAEMERGIAQVMHDMGPGAVFSFARSGITMKVDEWRAEPLEGIDSGLVADHLAGRVESFRNGDQPPWRDIRDRGMDFYRVTSVSGEFFPTTVVCKECNAVTYRDTPKGLRQVGGSCPRGDCSGDLQQIQFVLVHDCGTVTNLTPSPCDSCEALDHIYLKRGAPESLRTWSFRCDRCPSHKEELSGYCEGCGDYIGVATPVESGSVYYAQRDAIVEIPPIGVSEADIPYGEGWARVLMAAHLENPDLGADDIPVEKVAATEGIDEEQIENYVDKLGEENREIVLEMIRDLSPGDGFSRNAVVAMNEKDVTAPDDRNWHTLVAHQLFAYLRCTRGYQGVRADIEDVDRHPTPRSLDEFVEDDDFVEKHPEAKYYRKNLETLNVSDAWVVDNFPLLNLLFGYTRDSPSAGETDLQPFEHPYDDETLAIYGDRSPSEAIVLELDRRAIIEWLLENSTLVKRDAPDLNDDQALKQWFLENVDPREIQNPFTPIEDPMTEDVYTLIHSMSHALMSTASEQCGLDRDSISELLLPNVPAIILYAESMEHFALGGMFTLFKTQINDWIADTKKFASECIYDPACKNAEEAAECHACMHVSEFTCEYFNESLDRNMLVGSEDLDPFWDMSI